jgi:hypothetical protein
MANYVPSDIVEKWLKAWSLSRELPLPVKFTSGFKVDVGYEKQKARYIFPELNDDFIGLSKRIDEPWVFLKVCASPDEVKRCISGKWSIQPQGYMMSCFHPMDFQNIGLPVGYKLKFEHYNSSTLIKIVTKKGELASSGHVILVDDLAVYDRIETGINYRRKGLAICLMKELEKIALEKGIFKNFLVATEEGRLLYEFLGWELYSLYTSIVIPA